MPIVWTDELKERVKGYWETQTASQIASQLQSEGYAASRNSVVGVLHRMGVTISNKIEIHPATNNGPKKPRKPRAPKAKVIDLFAQARAQEEQFGSSNVRGFDDLQPHHCRYLVNDDTRDPLWCGRVVLAGKSWCGTHAALVFLPREERRAAA